MPGSQLGLKVVKMRLVILMVSLAIVLVSLGCSSKTIVAPAHNEILPSQDMSSDGNEFQILASGTMDLDNGTVEFTSRTVSPYYDVTTLVGPYFSYSIDGLIPPDILDINMTLVNPSLITVYDVCIVFENLYGKTVMNPDSYMDIFGPWDLDPFIAFRKEDPIREFPPGDDSEQVLIKYPGGSPMVDFFIIAHLGGNTGGVYEIRDWNVSGELTTSGGNANVSMRMLDHQNNVSLVAADTTAITGGITYFSQTGDPEIWDADISNTAGAPEGTYTIPVMGTSPSTPVYQTYRFFSVDVIQEIILDPTVFGSDMWLNSNWPGGNYGFVTSGGNHNMVSNDNKFYLVVSAGVENITGTYWGALYFLKSIDNGETWSYPTAITSEGDSYMENHPSMALHNGNLYIAYSQVSASGDYTMHLIKSADDGGSWSLFESFTNGPFDPSICLDTNAPGEKIYIACTDNDDCYVLSYDGGPLWVISRVNDMINPFKESSGPDIAFNPVTNKVMMAWYDGSFPGQGTKIFFDSSVDGITWGTDIFVGDTWEDFEHEENPRLAINPTTGVPGVLFDVSTSMSLISEMRFAKATDSTGTVFNPTVLLKEFERGSSSSLVCESNGRWMAVFYSRPNDSTKFDCYFNESLDDGQTWVNEQRVNDIPNPDTYNPVMASNGSDVVVAWTDHSSGDFEVYVDHGTH